MRKKIVVGPLFAAVLQMSQLLSATPNIVGAAGPLGQGQALVINGSAFSARGDFHPAADKLIRLFDDFNDGELRSNAYAVWGMYEPKALECRADGSRTGAPGDYFFRRNSKEIGFLNV